MRLLLLGSGGREHALAKAIAADPDVTALTCAPGNPGMAALSLANGDSVLVQPVELRDNAALVALAEAHRSDLVIVGPEAPLVAGVADLLRARGFSVFGPSAAAARIEGSKEFAKDVMASAGVPTADARGCASLAEVGAALDALGSPYVVKDDGLAAGKGVAVTTDRAAALAHAEAVLAGGHRVVVEEYLAGPEASIFVVCDGVTTRPLLPAQDFKRIGDGDRGPNTGGVGAYAPLPWAPPDLTDEVMARIVGPTLAEMDRRGAAFTGLLYVGLALTADGPKVIEFNCRFGDPETQSVVALLATPLGGVMHAAAAGRLSQMPPLRWRHGAAVTVIVAAAGYPGQTRTGDLIRIENSNIAGSGGILHAGTARSADGTLVSAGGRVLCCVGTGADLAAARDAAYALVAQVKLPGSQHRTDIAAAAAAGEIRVPSP